MAFKEGHIKPSALGHLLDPRRALAVPTTFRRERKRRRERAEKGRGESARGKESEKRGIFSKLRG